MDYYQYVAPIQVTNVLVWGKKLDKEQMKKVPEFIALRWAAGRRQKVTEWLGGLGQAAREGLRGGWGG